MRGDETHAASAHSTCLSEHDFRCLRGSTSKQERRRIRDHLETCGRCRDAFRLWLLAQTQNTTSLQMLAEEGVLEVAGITGTFGSAADWTVQTRPIRPSGRSNAPAAASIPVPSASPSPSEEVPDDLRDHLAKCGFEMIRKVAAGGMGQVYLVRDVRLDRTIALKTLQPHCLTDSGRERFTREVRAAAALNHPHIVPIYDCHLDDRVPFYTMPFIDGPGGHELIAAARAACAHELDAAALLQALGIDPSALSGQIRDVIAGPQPYYRLIAHWFSSLAEALHCLHRIGLCHRDVKPQNLMLARDGRLMLTDFGLAKTGDDPNMTQPGLLIGSSHYISPERLHGGGSDHQSDLYALGATLYEFLAYQHAHGGQDHAQVLAHIANRDPTPPRQLVPQVPLMLERVCLKALTRDPQQRYASAQKFAEALQAFLRPHTKDRSRKRRLLPMGALGLVLLISGGLAWYAGRAVAPAPDEGADRLRVTSAAATSPQPPSASERSSGTLAPREATAAPFDTPGSDRQPLPADQPDTESAALTTDLIGTGRLMVARGAAKPVIPAAITSTNPAAPVDERTVPEMTTRPAGANHGRPGILLAFNEDLDTSDETPPMVGGQAQRRMEMLLEKSGTFRLVSSSAASSISVWSRERALAEARKAGADYVLLCVSRTSPVREVRRAGQRGLRREEQIRTTDRGTRARLLVENEPEKVYAEWRTELTFDLLRATDGSLLGHVTILSESAIQTRGAAVIVEKLRKAVDEAVTRRGLLDAITPSR